MQAPAWAGWSQRVSVPRQPRNFYSTGAGAAKEPSVALAQAHAPTWVGNGGKADNHVRSTVPRNPHRHSQRHRHSDISCTDTALGPETEIFAYKTPTHLTSSTPLCVHFVARALAKGLGARGGYGSSPRVGIAGGKYLGCLLA